MANFGDVRWSSTFRAMPAASDSNKPLQGDRILLPQSALEALMSAPPSIALEEEPRDESLPLMFRLENKSNGKVVYSGVREFVGAEDYVGLTPYLEKALGVESDKPSEIDITAKQAPKGTYIRLRPLEAGYNPDDWKPILERELRKHFTTLTKDSELRVKGVGREEFDFLIDMVQPEGEAICVVDTDLEVDIEALDEEQARETLKIIAARSSKSAGNSGGGEIDIWKPVEGQVVAQSYVDYELPSWNRASPLTIKLTDFGDEDGLDLFVSPRSNKYRALPRQDEHVWGNFATKSDGEKSVTIRPDDPALHDCEGLLASVFSYAPQDPSPKSREVVHRFNLRARTAEEDEAGDVDMEDGESHDDQTRCPNCKQWVPKASFFLHENFCARNNVACKECGRVFKRGSEEFQNHWHCVHKNACDLFPDNYGNTELGRERHRFVYHAQHDCPSCDFTTSDLPELAKHRTTNCPAKLILCRFCHLEVPQGGDGMPTAEMKLTGLTPHELEDGSRTTQCAMCDRVIRLRDLDIHMKNHEMAKAKQPVPRLCRNANCGRTLYGVGPRGANFSRLLRAEHEENNLGLCPSCFTPLYSSVYDPEGKAMRRRIERRYLLQLNSGCGKAWCANEWCKTHRTNAGLEPMGTNMKAAMPLVKPLVESVLDLQMPMWFCVDETSAMNRLAAEEIAQEGKYEMGWCVAAAEATAGDVGKAREWLALWGNAKNTT